MRYTDLKIQTQREFPNNARTQGFGWLVRAGYVTRENELLPLGTAWIKQLEARAEDPDFVKNTGVRFILTEHGILFPIQNGYLEAAHCPACGYADFLDMTEFKKTPLPREDERPLEKISTPDCNTIDALANLLNIPKEKTAKALMYTRVEDGKFVFIAIRGDMQLSEEKLKFILGDVKLADVDAISRSGAAAGYASPIGLKDALIVVDDLIPRSQNLVAGANETGYHFLNTNYPRDYSAEIIEDLVLAKAGDPCVKCGAPLEVASTIALGNNFGFLFEQWMLALAETYHDEKGLTLPSYASPFDVYLMHVPGKTMDTKTEAEKIYSSLQSAGITVLFDDRDERAGVKFNDADLIGCPLRVTVGEKALQNGMVELKKRNTQNTEMILLEQVQTIKNII